MHTERLRRLAATMPLLAVIPLLAACENGIATDTKSASAFGEANRQTMMAQVVNPDPQYEYLDPATSGEHAAQAIERYRKGAVKQPERVTSTQISGGGGGR